MLAPEKIIHTHELERKKSTLKTVGSAVAERATEFQKQTFEEKAEEWQHEFGVTYSEPYPDTENRPKMTDLERRQTLVGYGEESVEATKEYLESMFPDGDFELISDEGSSAVVFGDDKFAYKVMRTPDRYSYIEGEMASIQKLHELGLAPKPVALIDVPAEYRKEFARKELMVSKFADTNIPRVQGSGELPIIVMERMKNPIPLPQAPKEQLKKLPDALEDMIKADIGVGDCELAYDTPTDRVVFIDSGGLGDMRKMDAEQKKFLTEYTCKFVCCYELGQKIDVDTSNFTVKDWVELTRKYLES